VKCNVAVKEEKCYVNGKESSKLTFFQEMKQ